MKIVVCDIDNCISDDSHRIHLIQDHPSGVHWAKYHAYHVACELDKADFIPEMNDRHKFQVFYITGMPEAYRAYRLRWFFKHGKKPGATQLRMRKNDDRRSSVEIKREIIINLLSKEFNPEDVVACYDDRREIVQMYCDLGLPGVHRAIRDEEFHYRATEP